MIVTIGRACWMFLFLPKRLFRRARKCPRGPRGSLPVNFTPGTLFPAQLDSRARKQASLLVSCTLAEPSAALRSEHSHAARALGSRGPGPIARKAGPGNTKEEQREGEAWQAPHAAPATTRRKEARKALRNEALQCRERTSCHVTKEGRTRQACKENLLPCHQGRTTEADLQFEGTNGAHERRNPAAGRPAESQPT